MVSSTQYIQKIMLTVSDIERPSTGHQATLPPCRNQNYVQRLDAFFGVGRTIWTQNKPAPHPARPLHGLQKKQSFISQEWKHDLRLAGTQRDLLRGSKRYREEVCHENNSRRPFGPPTVSQHYFPFYVWNLTGVEANRTLPFLKHITSHLPP